MKSNAIMLFGAILCLIPISAAQAGPYSDDLGKCVVSHMSENDQKDLIRWIFGAIALHPDIKRYSNITGEQHEAMDKAAAQLIERLLTRDCVQEAKTAIKYDGNVAIQTAFELAGRVAMTNIMQAPEVTSGMQNMAKFIDQKRFTELKK